MAYKGSKHKSGTIQQIKYLNVKTREGVLEVYTTELFPLLCSSTEDKDKKIRRLKLRDLRYLLSIISSEPVKIDLCVRQLIEQIGEILSDIE